MADQRRGAHPPRYPGLGVQPRGSAPAVHRDRQQHSLVGQLGDRALEPGDRQPEVVAEVALGGDAERAGGQLDQRPDRVLERRCRRLQSNQ